MTQVLDYQKKTAHDPVYVALTILVFVLVLVDLISSTTFMDVGSVNAGLRSFTGMQWSRDFMKTIINLGSPVTGLLLSLWLLHHLRTGPRRDRACVMVALALHLIGIYSAARGEVMIFSWIF